jgi:hypothetical protein
MYVWKSGIQNAREEGWKLARQSGAAAGLPAKVKRRRGWMEKKSL